MSKMNLEQFKQLERIKIAYLKHRGNVLAVANELKLPVEYTKKRIAKIKGQERNNVDVLISNTLMQHILLGYESRVSYLMEMLKSLANREQLYVSLCCGAPVERARGEEEYTAEVTYICLACHSIASVKLIDRETIYNIKQRVLEQLRVEDSALVEFADKMGYTNRPEQPPAVKQNILVLGKDFSKEDRQVVTNLSELSPPDREKMIKKLEKQITNIQQKE